MALVGPPWRLFVYGTLRQGFVVNDVGKEFLRRTDWLGEAHLPGSLFQIEWYPGFVEDGEGSVRGDVYALPEDASFLTQLDHYEMIGESFPEPHEYRRVARTVRLTTGAVQTWVYVYNWPVDAGRRIDSGDWKDAAGPEA